MSCRTLQVVGNRPVILEVEILFDHRRNDRGRTAELRMAKCVPQALVRQEFPVRPAHTF